MIESILNGFDVWTEAQGVKSKGRVKSIDNISQDGVIHLRELILNLAFTGRLCPNSTEELEIQNILELTGLERQEYHKERNVRLQEFKPLKVNTRDIKHPQNWAMVYFNDVIKYITDFQANGSFATLKQNVKYYEDENYAVLVRLTDLRHNLDSNKSFVYTDKKGYDFLSKSSIHGGELVIANVGAGVGTTLEIPHIGRPATLAPNMFMIVLSDQIDKEYFLYYTKSKFYWDYINQVNVGTGQPKINKTEYKSCKIPFPPLEEQKRVVSKIKELMLLCDKLEEQQTATLTTHHYLVKSLLETLTNTADADELQDAWQKLSEHFDTLFCTEDSIEQLKQTILQLAIMGRLVKQEANDKPVSELLKKIKEINEPLIKEGKLRKLKVLPSIEEDEFPFSLPSGWEYVRLNEIGEWGSGATPNRSNPDFYNGNIPWFKSGELSSDFIDTSEEHITEKALKETSVRYNNVGDVLIAMYGATIGKTSILKVRATTNQAVCACTPFYGIENTYLLMLLKAYKNRFTGMGAGGAQPNISREKIINTVIALPPTEEQKRIVLKVNQLMAICDLISSRLSKSQEVQNLLSQTVIEVIS